MKKTLILGIETSCDETSLALVEARGGLTHSTDSTRLAQAPAERASSLRASSGRALPKFKVLENLIASQIKIHRPFGGVVPNLAKREHLRNLPLLWNRFKIKDLRFRNNNRINHKSKIVNPPIDMIAVTVGPGLEPALWAGIEFAKQLHHELQAISHKPIALVGANHLEGHLYSFLLPKKTVSTNHKTRNSKKPTHYSLLATRSFPAVALLVSGGHTILLLLKDLKTWKKLGETRDDAVGEAFDKVARILGLPYPGGPALEKLALSLPKGRKSSINFPRPMLHQKNYDFSFSGLKTAVLYYVRDTNTRMHTNDANSINKANIAASFQTAAIDVLITKTLRAAREFGAKSILLCGGVAANKALRARLVKECSAQGRKFFAPEPEFNTDNAAMIAAAGYMSLLRKPRRPSGVGVPTATSGKYPLTAKGNMTV